MNAGTFAVLLVIAALVYVCIRYLAENGLDSCNGDCAGCGPSCKWARDIKKAQKDMARKRRWRKILHLE